MARHRAPSARSRMITTLAVTGAALGAAVASPATALAATHDGGRDATHGEAHDGARLDRTTGRHHAHSRRHPRPAHRTAGHARTLRPLTSGEDQYRTGCRRGYITQGCAAYSVTSLLDRGINPDL